MNGHEEWRPIPGFEGLYEVSSLGRVRSLHRRNPGRLLRTRIQVKSGIPYEAIALSRAGQNVAKYTYSLVASAFLGTRPSGLVVRHLDGDSLNNHLSNLAYGTPSENARDAVRHGTHVNTRKTHCVNGHPFDAVNTYLWRGTRCCRRCRASAVATYKTRRVTSEESEAKR